MQIEAFKVFCDLRDTKSFTKSAHINGISQPAVSATVRALERLCKSRLVDVSRNNFRLTSQGEVLYTCSKQILQDYEVLRNKMQEIRSVLSGNIHLATVFSIGLYDLPPFITRFRKEYPAVNVQVQYCRANRVYELVLGNVVDLGLVAFPERQPNLEIIPFRKERLIVVCPLQHPFAKLKAIKLRALNGQKMIGFEPDITTGKAIEKMLRAGGVRAEFVMQFESLETVKRAVEIGCGVAILPSERLQEGGANRRLAVVRLQGDYFRQLAVIQKRSKVLSPQVRQFVKLLKKSSL
jgi:DNA-binding transcriptional LysR family regulator